MLTRMPCVRCIGPIPRIGTEHNAFLHIPVLPPPPSPGRRRVSIVPGRSRGGRVRGECVWNRLPAGPGERPPLTAAPRLRTLRRAGASASAARMLHAALGGRAVSAAQGAGRAAAAAGRVGGPGALWRLLRRWRRRPWVRPSAARSSDAHAGRSPGPCGGDSGGRAPGRRRGGDAEGSRRRPSPPAAAVAEPGWGRGPRTPAGPRTQTKEEDPPEAGALLGKEAAASVAAGLPGSCAGASLADAARGQATRARKPPRAPARPPAGAASQPPRP